MTKTPITRVAAHDQARKLMADATVEGRKLGYNQAMHRVAKANGYANLQEMKSRYLPDDTTQPTKTVSPLLHFLNTPLEAPAPAISPRLAQAIGATYRIGDPGISKSRLLMKPFPRKVPVFTRSIPTSKELNNIFLDAALTESPDFPKSSWQHDVSEDKTTLGYWDCVQAKYAANNFESPNEDNARGVWEFALDSGAPTYDYWHWLAHRHANPPKREPLFGTDVIEMTLKSVAPEDVKAMFARLEAANPDKSGTDRKTQLKSDNQKLFQEIKNLDDSFGSELQRRLQTLAGKRVEATNMNSRMNLVAWATAAGQPVLLQTLGRQHEMITTWNLRDLAIKRFADSAVFIDATDLPNTIDDIAKTMNNLVTGMSGPGIVVITGYDKADIDAKSHALIYAGELQRYVAETNPIPAGWTIVIPVDADNVTSIHDIVGDKFAGNIFDRFVAI